MDSSNVYFTDFRTRMKESVLQKLRRLITSAGFADIDFDGKFTAIKTHFGEPGNTAFLRPNYARVVVDMVRERGGNPFLTDANTLYVGARKNALDHLTSAYGNGFSPLAVGCHVLIADGLKGGDETIVPVDDGEYVKNAKIGRAIMDADVVISLTHFKMHEAAGFGGAIKNIGMGSGSRAGKMEMHSSGKPHINADLCVGCGVCAKGCAHGAITLTENRASIDSSVCVGCGRCISLCPKDAAEPASDESNDILNCKMAEYTAAVLRGRPSFHISMVMDVSPFCDCYGLNDAPVVPDVGMFASFDPVALDQACADAVNAQIPERGSLLAERDIAKGDYSKAVHPATDWTKQLIHAEKLGLGSRSYVLKRMD